MPCLYMTLNQPSNFSPNGSHSSQYILKSSPVVKKGPTVKNVKFFFLRLGRNCVTSVEASVSGDRVG